MDANLCNFVSIGIAIPENRSQKDRSQKGFAAFVVNLLPLIEIAMAIGIGIDFDRGGAT
jgi:hypothetical protein